MLKIEETEYSGYWKANKREGHGTFTKASDFAFGHWHSNALIE